MSSDRPETATAQGTLRGITHDGAVAFRGIPYAASPVGELRFRPPAVHPRWTRVRDASEPGPSVPQCESRLSNVNGPSPVDWDEDGCLSLNVWVPEVAITDRRPRPVLFWIHGGGFSSGSGGWSLYDGSRLAADGDIVVVTINYRLGALGYLWLPEVGAGNIGPQDQIAALRWVYDNIASFGGDPTAITVGGQSAGAYAALSLALDPATRPLVSKVLAQSGPWAVSGQQPSDAHSVAYEYLSVLGIDPSGELLDVLQDVPVDDLLAAYNTVAVAHPSSDAAPPMFPVLGGIGLPRTLMDRVDRGGLRVPVLIGRTEHEMTAFLPDITDPKDAADATSFLFGDGIDRIAEVSASQGNSVFVYRFDRVSTGAPALGATHCAELPFMFNHLEAYIDAPMLGPVDETDRALALEFSSAITTFVKTGFADGSGWPADRSVNSRTAAAAGQIKVFGARS